MSSPKFISGAMILALTMIVSPAACQSLREIGRISAPHAAFTSIVHLGYLTDPLERNVLVISGFSPIPLLHDTIYQVHEIAKHLNNPSAATVTEVTRDVTWPNEAVQVPYDVFNSSSMVAAAGGFLVPLKDHGSLTLFDLDRSPPVKHVVSNSGEDAQWFYHRVLWMDMNGDGLKDIVTCRARNHLVGGAEGQLVWFEHPKQNALSHTWHSHVISSHNADIFFIVTSLPTPNGDVTCIITAGFFSHALAVFWSVHPNGRWDDNTQIRSRVIDDTIGAVFDVRVGDLNLDGNLDLLVSNNALHNASVFAYVVPADFRKDAFPRKTLSTGYMPRTQGVGKGAPGSVELVHPRNGNISSKPWIIVSGDDDGRAYLLSPSSNNPSDWSYKQTAFLDVGTNTVGEIAIGDVNLDGYNEVFVPSFNDGVVHVFTFKP